jgi:hypothetical protein
MALSAYIGGGQVTTWQEATSEHWLNRTYVATIKIPVSQIGPDATGQRLALVDPDMPGPDLDFHGIIKNCSAQDGEDGDGMVEYTAYSAREILESRLCRDGPSDADDPGNYVTPDFMARLKKGPLMMEDVLLQSADGSDPAQGEGSMPIAMGSFPSSGVDLSGTPATFPLSIEALANLLASTGEFDMVETMIDSGGNTSQIDCHNGNYGGIGGGDYAFEPDGNVRSITYTRDMSKMRNKIRYLLGPRKTSERWGRSIEATNSDIPDTSTYSQGALVSAIMGSRATYGVRFEVRTYDTFGNEASAVPLYWRLWQDESLWRLQPRLLVKLTPIEGLPPTFDVGAQLGVSWWSGFMGGGSGTQRCYGRKVTWDVDGVCSVGEIQTSSDADSLA